MESIKNAFASVGVDFYDFCKVALVLLAGTILIGMIARLIFGKKSTLGHSVSSAIGILFILALTVVLRSAGAQFQDYVTATPFVEFAGDQLILFPFADAHYTLICTELLNMIILAFFINLLDRWLPTGKKLLSWLLFRCLTIAIGFVLQLIIVTLLEKYLPAGIVTYAPAILLVILVSTLLAGILKIVIGAFLTTVNPIIGGLYTFFFVTAVGKQITRAVLTTAILAGLVIGIQALGIVAISIAEAALAAYIPFLLLLAAVWYMDHKIF